MGDGDLWNCEKYGLKRTIHTLLRGFCKYYFGNIGIDASIYNHVPDNWAFVGNKGLTKVWFHMFCIQPIFCPCPIVMDIRDPG